MKKLRENPNLRQTKSDLNVPATNTFASRASDAQSRLSASTSHSSPTAHTHESLGKRFGHGLKGLFRGEMQTPKSAVEASPASTRPPPIVLPSSELVQPEASPISDRNTASTTIPTPPIPTPESIPDANVIFAGTSEEKSTTQPSTEVPQKIKLGSTILRGAKTVLELMTESADALPQLRSVLGGIRAVVKLCEVSKCYDV